MGPAGDGDTCLGAGCRCTWLPLCRHRHPSRWMVTTDPSAYFNSFSWKRSACSKGVSTGLSVSRTSCPGRAPALCLPLGSCHVSLEQFGGGCVCPWPRPSSLLAGQAAGSIPASGSHLGQSPGWLSPLWRWEWHAEPQAGLRALLAASQVVLGTSSSGTAGTTVLAGWAGPAANSKPPARGRSPLDRPRPGSSRVQVSRARAAPGWVCSLRRLRTHNVFAAAVIKLRFPERHRCALLAGLGRAGDVLTRACAWGDVCAGRPARPRATGCRHHHPRAVPRLPCSTSGEGSMLPSQPGAAAAQGGGAPQQGCTDYPADALEPRRAWVQLLWVGPDPAASSPYMQPLA